MRLRFGRGAGGVLRKTRSKQTRISIESDEFLDLVEGSSEAMLIASLANINSPDDMAVVLDDLLTEPELVRLVARFRACIASRIAESCDVTETAITKRLNLNYTTYNRIKRLNKRGSGGLEIAVDSASLSFRELSLLQGDTNN